MQLFAFIINLALFLTVSQWANAVVNPFDTANNKIGIHIFSPDEIETASKLVNNDRQADWGYVTVPIQSTERDRLKWQKFFDKCTELHVIPIIRVATFAEGSNWATPNDFDLVDFANFLNDLSWPTRNRYVIIFNEVNRSDEFGGFVNPEKYTDILNNAIDIFKSLNQDFFLLPAGLDNAAANTKNSMAWRRYVERMYLHNTQIFDKIDGWTSHAYPNPDFSSRPDISGGNKIDSFVYDLRLIRQFTTKDLPVFITEAGWSNRNLSDHQVSLYYKSALEHAWSDKRIVAITPFVLTAQDGPFKQFSFLDSSQQPKEFATEFFSYATIGSPELPTPTPQPTPQQVSSPSAAPSQEAKEPSARDLIGMICDNLKSLLDLFTP